MVAISRSAYAEMFGPTTGDKVRLADTELWLQVEDDLTHYGEDEQRRAVNNRSGVG